MKNIKNNYNNKEQLILNKMSIRINIVDNIYKIISSLTNIEIKDKITHTVPIVIAVGDQSAGKSSIIGKILGHELPNARGMCTRIATKISTRRDNVGIHVRLIDLTNQKKNQIYNHGSIEERIKQAQLEVFDKINEYEKFSSNHLIEVIVGSHAYNLTLIDLPGLIAFNSEDFPDPT